MFQMQILTQLWQHTLLSLNRLRCVLVHRCSDNSACCWKSISTHQLTTQKFTFPKYLHCDANGESFQILETWRCSPKRTTVVLQAPSAKEEKGDFNVANHVILLLYGDPSKKSFVNVFSSKPLWIVLLNLKKRSHAYLVWKTACVMWKYWFFFPVDIAESYHIHIKWTL